MMAAIGTATNAPQKPQRIPKPIKAITTIAGLSPTDFPRTLGVMKKASRV
jgi:hypothetical protein